MTLRGDKLSPTRQGSGRLFWPLGVAMPCECWGMPDEGKGHPWAGCVLKA